MLNVTAKNERGLNFLSMLETYKNAFLSMLETYKNALSQISMLQQKQ